MTVQDAVERGKALWLLDDALNTLAVRVGRIQDEIPGFLATIFTSDDRDWALSVRQRVTDEKDRIEALEVPGL